MEEINASGKKAAFHIKSKKPLSTEGKKFSPIQMQSTLSKFWKFEVDYNDHFETPLIAYKDIDLILITIAKSVGKSKDDLIIYDPYYCHGQMVNHLSSLGYTKIINSNTDFYADIKHKKIPEFDVLVTNPPYSGDHKTRLFNYLQSIAKPSLLLLPAYIATKSYWRSFVETQSQSSSSSSSSSSNSSSSSSSTYSNRYEHAYLLPHDSYQYQHPEGTGKSQPPFYSAWFLSLTSSVTYSSLKQLYEAKSTFSLSPSTLSTSRPPCKIVNDVQDIVRLGYVTDKRPNPKARKRKQLKIQQHEQGQGKSQRRDQDHNMLSKDLKKKRRF